MENENGTTDSDITHIASNTFNNWHFRAGEGDKPTNDEMKKKAKESREIANIIAGKE